MKKPMKKATKSPVKDVGKVKMAAVRGGVSPGAKVPGGSGPGTEAMPKGFGGGRVKGGGIAGRQKGDTYA